MNRFSRLGPTLGRIGAALLCGSLLALASGAQAALVRMGVSDSTVQVGDEFTLRLGLQRQGGGSASALSAFDLHLDFEAGSAGFLGADFIDPASGLNMLDLAEPAAFPFLGEASELGAGRINAFGLSGNSPDLLDAQQSADFVFLNLHFRALAEDADAWFKLDLNDPGLLFASADGMPMQLRFDSSELSLRFVADNGHQVAEPPMLALSGLALLLCGLGRRRLGRASALAAGAFAVCLSATAAPPQAAAVQGSAASTAPQLEAEVIEVQGQRLKLRDAQGRETWFTLRHKGSALDLLGKRVRGQVSTLGDAQVFQLSSSD